MKYSSHHEMFYTAYYLTLEHYMLNKLYISPFSFYCAHILPCFFLFIQVVWNSNSNLAVHL